MAQKTHPPSRSRSATTSGSLAAIACALVGAAGCGAFAANADGSSDGGGLRDALNPSDGAVQDAPPTDAPTDAGNPPTAPRCPDPARPVPVPTGSGSYRCESVGDRFSSGAPTLALMSLPGPIVFVGPAGGADAGPGTGTSADPFRSIDDAVRVRPRSIVIYAGSYTLATSIPVTGPLTIVGDLSTGAMRTQIIAPANGDPAVAVSGAAGDATISWLEILGAPAGRAERGAGIRVAGGANAGVNNVTVRDATVGIEVTTGALARLEDITVQDSQGDGVRITMGSRASLRSVQAIGGAAVGIRVSGARATITASFAQNNAGGGIALVDTGVPTGETDVLDRVTAMGNTGFGLALAGATTRVTGTLLESTGTRNPAIGLSAALLVRRGAQIALDARITTDTARGHGSRLEFNGGVGIAAADTGTRVNVSGADVVWNDSVGLLAQGGASYGVVGYSHFGSNTGAAVVLLNVAAVPILCNAIDGTRAGTLRFDTGTTDPVGVGLLLASGPGMAFAELARNAFERNATHNAVFIGARANLTLNTGFMGEQTVIADSATTFSGNPPVLRTFGGIWPTADGRLAIPDLM